MIVLSFYVSSLSLSLSLFVLVSFVVLLFWIVHAPLLERAVQARAALAASRGGVPTRLLQVQSRLF